MIVWRICQRAHIASALEGVGAATYGGRWNGKGTRVVYAAESRALAVLETRVHLSVLPVPGSYVLLPVTIPGGLSIDEVGALPRDWHRTPPPPSLAKIGDAWVKRKSSAVLRVPSAVVPGESNYLIDSLHPDVAKITVGRPERIAFERLF